MQHLFIFILILCALMILGLLGMGLLLQKVRLRKKNSAPLKDIYPLYRGLCYLGGIVLALATFTTGMFSHLGESILYLPLIPLFIGALAAEKFRRMQKALPEDPIHPMQALWEKSFGPVLFTEKSTFAEKNTLESQAFGNDMYMTQSQRIESVRIKDIRMEGMHDNTSFAQYSLCLPDYFSGRGITVGFATPFPTTLFIIHKNFPCSQLLTYAGLWQQVPTEQEDFDASYVVFSKEPHTVSKFLTPHYCKALLDFAAYSSAPQSYYFNENTVYIVLTEEDAKLSTEQEILRMQYALAHLKP